MKKFVIAVLIIGAFVFYSLIYSQANPVALLPTSSTDANASTRSSITSTSVGSSNPGILPTITPGATSVAGSLYKDGSYTGSVADAQWGYIQVKAIIQNGKITDVQFLQYPNERQRSEMINNYADPRLTSEAIQAQSANVDIITGATDSSEAFIQSLSDALSQARV